MIQHHCGQDNPVLHNLSSTLGEGASFHLWALALHFAKAGALPLYHPLFLTPNQRLSVSKAAAWVRASTCRTASGHSQG